MHIGRMIGQFQEAGKSVMVLDVNKTITANDLEGCDASSVVVARGLGNSDKFLRAIIENFDVTISVKGK